MRMHSYVLLMAALVAPAVEAADAYPVKPIRFVTTETGGGADIAARIVVPGLSASLGQQVIVENRGGSVVIPAQLVVQAVPDGYTLLFLSDSVWKIPFLQDNVPYSPLRDFAPVTLIGTSPVVLVVNPSLPVNSVSELIALAKAKPGQLNFATGAAGGINHLAPELFKAMAGINIVRIVYKGAGPALNDVVAGQVQMMFPAAASGMQFVKSGRLKGLAVTSAQPTPLAPGLPTIAASGLPGYEATLMLGLLGPAKLPAALVQRLNHDTVAVLNRADVKEKLLNTGVEVVGSTPEQFGATVRGEMAKWGKLIKDAGIKGD